MWQIGVVLMIRFSEPLAFTSLFPYVYFMVRDFHVTKDPTQISRYTGYLAALFAISQFFCCIHWGRLSDRIGRKPVLICGLLGTASTILLFGFSRNFYMALFARTAAGALNGNMAVLQTMVGEITTEKRHQLVAFSLLPFLWNVGCFVGPLIGGSRYLTRPRMAPDPETDPETILVVGSSRYWQFVDRNPYAMSNVVVAGFLLTLALIGVVFLEETHSKQRLRYDPGLVVGDWIRRRLGYHIPPRPWEGSCKRREGASEEGASGVREEREREIASQEERVGDADRERMPLLAETETTVSDDDFSISSYDATAPEALVDASADASALQTIRRYSSAYSLQPDLLVVMLHQTVDSVAEETRSLFRAFGNRAIFTPQVVATIAAYFFIAFHSLIFTEFMPVFLASPTQPDHLQFPWVIKGGLGWETESIGRILSTTGVFGCVFVLVLFPIIDKRLGTVRGFRLATSVFPLTYIVFPFIVFTSTAYNPLLPSWLTKVCLYACVGASVFGTSLAFPQVSILMYNAAPARYRTFVNSSGMSATALARFIGPLLWGTLISYFDKKSMGAVPWILLGAVGSCTFTIAMSLPATL